MYKVGDKIIVSIGDYKWCPAEIVELTPLTVYIISGGLKDTVHDEFLVVTIGDKAISHWDRFRDYCPACLYRQRKERDK